MCKPNYIKTSVCSKCWAIFYEHDIPSLLLWHTNNDVKKKLSELVRDYKLLGACVSFDAHQWWFAINCFKRPRIRRLSQELPLLWIRTLQIVYTTDFIMNLYFSFPIVHTIDFINLYEWICTCFGRVKDCSEVVWKKACPYARHLKSHSPLLNFDNICSWAEF